MGLALVSLVTAGMIVPGLVRARGLADGSSCASPRIGGRIATSPDLEKGETSMRHTLKELEQRLELNNFGGPLFGPDLGAGVWARARALDTSSLLLRLHGGRSGRRRGGNE